jgi:hypothetical protein
MPMSAENASKIKFLSISSRRLVVTDSSRLNATANTPVTKIPANQMMQWRILTQT